MRSSGQWLRIEILALLLIYGTAGGIQAQNTTVEKKSTDSKITSVPVGMVGKIDQIVIPGGELEAVPDTDPTAKIMVRVADIFRHGDAHRYDLEYTGFEPGRYDLAKSLRRKNPDESAANIPPIEIEIVSTLEPGRIEPSRPDPPVIRDWMKYWTKLNVFVGFWIAGLALLFRWSNRVTSSTEAMATPPPLTVAQRLRPLVQAACDGTIEPHRRAELESLLIAYWTDRLNLNEGISPGRVLTTLKQDPEAGPLVSRLEEWLHRPPGQGRASAAEISELLKPYETVPDLQPTEVGIGKGAN